MCYEDLFSLQGRTALVTGASHGPGFYIACQLAYAGAVLVFQCGDEQQLVDGQQAFEEMGIQAHGRVCDLTREAAIVDLVNELMDSFGSVDILVNHVEIQKRKSMTDMKMDAFGGMIDRSLAGAFLVSRTIIPGMVGLGGGKIINICSMAKAPGDGFVPTCVSARGSLKMLTESIASEYGRYNIQCNGIYPCCISRETQYSLYRTDCSAGCQQSRGDWESGGKLIGPVMFLASHASDPLNGQILYVSGGCERAGWC